MVLIVVDLLHESDTLRQDLQQSLAIGKLARTESLFTIENKNKKMDLVNTAKLYDGDGGNAQT